MNIMLTTTITSNKHNYKYSIYNFVESYNELSTRSQPGRFQGNQVRNVAAEFKQNESKSTRQ